MELKNVLNHLERKCFLEIKSRIIDDCVFVITIYPKKYVFERFMSIPRTFELSFLMLLKGFYHQPELTGHFHSDLTE